MSRLLKSAIFGLALLLVSPASAQFATFTINGGSSGYNGPYQGNANVSISSITPAINCVQVDGGQPGGSVTTTLVTPAFIQCSAENTTSVGTSRPFSDLEFTWNFGDPSGTESITHPISGIPVNANDHQWGPLAAYVWRAAGTYTITLRVRGCANGHPATRYLGGGGACLNGAFTRASVTKTVTVSAFVPTTDLYFNASTGADGNICSLASPCQHLSKLRTLIASAGNNARYNLDCTQTFSDAADGIIETANQSYAHLRIRNAGADCPGADPVVSVTGGTDPMFWIGQNGAGGVKSDIVISHIKFTNGGSFAGAEGLFLSGNNTGGGSLNFVYFDNVTEANTLDIAGWPDINIQNPDNQPLNSTFSGVVIWNSVITSPLTATTTETGIIGGPSYWFTVSATSVSGTNDTTNTPHKGHEIYSHCGGRCAFRWNTLGPSCNGGGCTPTRNSCIKTSWDSGSGFSTTARYVLATENKCVGNEGFGAPGNNNNNVATLFEDYISQQNLVNQTNGGGGFFPANPVGYTVRDIWSCAPGTVGSGIGFSFMQMMSNNTLDDGNIVALIYRNLVWQNMPSGNGVTFDARASADTYTNAFTITDNLFENDNASAQVANAGLTNQVSIGSTWDYNTYYAPNNGSNFLQNAGSGVSFATWQTSVDTHGANTNPNWSAPSTCGFGAWPYN